MVEMLAQIVCGSSSGNINQYIITEPPKFQYISPITNLDFHQYTISESSLTLVPIKMFISTVKMAVLRMFSFLFHFLAKKLYFLYQPTRENPIFERKLFSAHSFIPKHKRTGSMEKASTELIFCKKESATKCSDLRNRGRGSNSNLGNTKIYTVFVGLGLP